MESITSIVPLLTTRRERPFCRRTAVQRNELAPPHHLITSSAATRNLSRTSRPSVLVVLRLRTNSNLVAWITGRSAASRPSPGIDADLAIQVDGTVVIAHQIADHGIVACRVHRRGSHDDASVMICAERSIRGSWATNSALALSCTKLANTLLNSFSVMALSTF